MFVGCWLVVDESWMLVYGFGMSLVCNWLLYVEFRLFIVGCLLLVVGCWVLVVGCW